MAQEGLSSEVVVLVTLVSVAVGATVKEVIAWIVQLARRDESKTITFPIPGDNGNGKYVREDLCQARQQLMDERFSTASKERIEIKKVTETALKKLDTLSAHLMGE